MNIEIFITLRLLININNSMIFLTFFDSREKKSIFFDVNIISTLHIYTTRNVALLCTLQKPSCKKKKKNLFKDFQKNSILEIQRSPLIAPFNRATIATAPPIFTEHFLRAASSSRHAFLRVRGTPCHEFPAFEYKT